MSLWIALSRVQMTEVCNKNITHNLALMAEKAGIFKCLWRAEESGFRNAFQLIKPLRNGIKKLKSNPKRFCKYNARNGWGTYDHFVPWLEELLEACEKYPDAEITTSK